MGKMMSMDLSISELKKATIIHDDWKLTVIEVKAVNKHKAPRHFTIFFNNRRKMMTHGFLEVPAILNEPYLSVEIIPFEVKQAAEQTYLDSRK